MRRAWQWGGAATVILCVWACGSDPPSDGNVVVPDGDATDLSEDAFVPSVPPRCGDGTVQAGEVCDDGNALATDGCTGKCDAIESGYACPQPGRACVKIEPASWMNGIADRASLSQLSIPGTHESCALHEPLSGVAKCQELSLADQMNAGIRFMDIRCRHYKNSFEIHHGPIYQEMNFDDVLAVVFDFLKAHPSETILMSIKDEYNAADNNRSYEGTFNYYVAKNPAGWLLDETIPTLGNSRGKIVLVRRFDASPRGLDATSWQDNTTFAISGKAPMNVQDHYKVGNNDDKWRSITDEFEAAKSGDPNTLYFNFTSGYQSTFLIPNNWKVSDAINPKLDAYYATNSIMKGRYGVVAMDHVNASRAGQVYERNFH